MDANLRQRLANQMSRGEVVLFTGAGFSRAARGRTGEPMPSVQELKARLWPVAFPGEPLDRRSSLGDIYHCAARNAGNRAGELLRGRLSVDTASLPDIYKVWFSMPWYRIYTLNVDDLDAAAQLSFQLPRRIRAVSALKEGLPPGGDLLSVHLNGMLADYPEMTFSPPQYGERTTRPDPWYSHLVADLAGHPVLFVGTELDEPPLWHHMELRRGRARGARDLRPGSYIITPSLALARQGLLRDFKIALVEMTQEEFAAEVLAGLRQEKEKGLEVHMSRASGSGGGRLFQRVGEVRNQPTDQPGEFLLGREPTWGDISGGTAVEREFEANLRHEIDGSGKRLVILDGHAPSGRTKVASREEIGLLSEMAVFLASMLLFAGEKVVVDCRKLAQHDAILKRFEGFQFATVGAALQGAFDPFDEFTAVDGELLDQRVFDLEKLA